MTLWWTPERTEALKALLADGRSASEIAAALGAVSRSGVCGKIMRLRDAGEIDGPRGFQTSDHQTRSGRGRASPGLAHVPLIKARFNEGRSDREIADEIGIKPDDVRYVRRIKKFRGKNVRLPPPWAVQLGDLARAGKTDREVAAALGISMSQARGERRRQGLKGVDSATAGRNAVTTIVKGDSGVKVSAIFAEGFMGQRSRVDLVDLERGMCKFPIDQPEGPPRYCGDRADDGQVYCSHHAARCYTAGTPVKAIRPSHVYQARR